MKKVFISGSIEIKSLPESAKKSIDNILNKKFSILIGDAHGIDTIVQKYISEKDYTDVCVYTVKNSPRNILNEKFKFKTIDFKNCEEYKKLSEEEKKEIEYSERRKQFFKDEAMVNDSDYLLAIWDGKSQGTKNNIINGIKLNKYIKLILAGEVIPKQNINIDSIEKIYEGNSGIGFKELKNRFNDLIGSENIPSSELLKKYKDLQKIYPYNSKSFLEGLNEYKNYLISTNYKGNNNIKYKPSIIEKLKFDYFSVMNSIQEGNLLFK